MLVAWLMPGGALSTPSRRGRNPAGRRRRPSSSSTNSTGLKGRRGTKSRMTAKRRPTTGAAFARNIAVPVLNALKAWLDAIAPKVVPDTKLEDAVSYTLNQWEYLTRYTEDGRMPIDNNLLERDIRIFATGQKELALQRYSPGRQGQRRHLQPDVDLPGLPRRTLRVVATRSHRTAAASRRCRYRGPAALQLQKTASLNPALRRVLKCALTFHRQPKICTG